MRKTPLPLFAAAAFLLVFPFFVNRRMRVVRRKTIRAKPAEIFPFINDLRNWPLWTEWSQRDEMHFAYDGPPAGVGAVQQWSTDRMQGALKIIQSVADTRIAYELDMAGGKWRIDGVIALEPAGEFTSVTWTCKWDSGPNPYAVYLGLFMKRCIARDFAAGLVNLKDLVETKAPAPV
jgi:polyketide cyclase/dehydrase/lipid transport protein